MPKEVSLDQVYSESPRHVHLTASHFSQNHIAVCAWVRAARVGLAGAEECDSLERRTDVAVQRFSISQNEELAWLSAVEFV